MLQQLKNWMASHMTKPQGRPASGRPGFRAHVERLESRLVLSASIGPSPADVVSAGTGWWDSPATFATRPDHAPISLGGAAHWEDSPTTGLTNRQVPTARFARAALMASADGLNAFLPERAGGRVFVITIYVPMYGVSAKLLPPIGMPREPVPSTIPKPIAATSPYAPSQNEPSIEPPRTWQSAVAPTERLGRLLAASLVSADSLGVAQHALVQRRDVPVESRSTDSLLLAAELYESANANLYRVFDEWRTGLDRDESGFVGLDEASLQGETTSLDTVWQEHEAVDAVFGELRELRIRRAEPINDATEERPPANVTDRQEFVDDEPPAVIAQATYAPHDVADGGMVLLIPNGDANLGIGDLIEAVVGTVENTNRLPICVEASIGIYQAIDVGRAESPNADSASAPATRAAVGRPNLTGENAAEMRTEKPS